MKERDYILIGIALFLLAQKGQAKEKSFLGDMSKPRGIRNNNPGNLVITGIDWKGKVPIQQNTDGMFEQFENWYYGVRAMWIDLKGDVFTDGDNTIRKLIHKYAPPFENPTETYIQYVANFTGKSPDELIQENDMYGIIDAISRFENYTEPRPQVITQQDFEIAKTI